MWFCRQGIKYCGLGVGLSKLRIREFKDGCTHFAAVYSNDHDYDDQTRIVVRRGVWGWMHRVEVVWVPGFSIENVAGNSSNLQAINI